MRYPAGLWRSLLLLQLPLQSLQSRMPRAASGFALAADAGATIALAEGVAVPPALFAALFETALAAEGIS